jgi:hypothetical protein
MVPPTLELEAVLTTALEPAVLWEEAAWVAAVEAALVVLELLLELPPHAASKADAASSGMSSLIGWRIIGVSYQVSVDFSDLPLETPSEPFPSGPHHDPAHTAN